MNYKAIIFDMDGTIIETEHIWRQATGDVIRARGIEVTPDLQHQIATECRGMGIAKSCIFIKDLVGLSDSVDTLISEKRARANAMYSAEVRFIEGFQDFHRHLVENNIKTALATNACDSTLAITNQTLKLDNYFGNHLYNVSTVNGRPKPDPAMFLYAAEQLDIHPEDCIVIEDSGHGIQAARAAGMFCIGINSSNDRSLVKDAPHIIDGYHELRLSTIPKKQSKE